MLKIWLTVAGLLLFAGTAFAGVVVEWQDGEKAFLSDGKFKSTAGDGSWVVFDTAKQTMLSVNDRQQSYSLATIEEFCAAVRTLYEEQLTQLPPELRALVKEEMKALAGQKGPDTHFEIKNGGNGGEIAGYPTTRYEVYRNGEKEKEFYLAEKTAANAETEVGLFWDMAFKLSECSAPDEQKAVVVVEQDPAYRKLVASGWVMKEVDLSTGEGAEEAVVLSMEKKPIYAVEFAPPESYRKLSAVDFMRQEMVAEEEKLAPPLEK